MLDVKFLAAGSTAEEAMSFICELTFNLINEKRGKYKIDINTLHRMEEKEIGLNDIGRISIRTTKPLFFDSYTRNRNTGSIILVDESSNETVAAGMII